MLTDDDIIFKLLDFQFDDDNTFSNCPKGYAIIGVYETDPRLIPGFNDSENSAPESNEIPTVELRLIDPKYYFTKLHKKGAVLLDISQARPFIWLEELANHAS